MTSFSCHLACPRNNSDSSAGGLRPQWLGRVPVLILRVRRCHRHSPKHCVCVCETEKEQTWQGSLLSRVIFVFLSLQSAGETEASIVAQNKACYESGIVCMKMLVIHVGLTKIYFTDNSGTPVCSTLNHCLFTLYSTNIEICTRSYLH